jgi:hypothetical protein
MKKKILEKLRGNVKLYSYFRNLYGGTFGFWWFKSWYAKNIGFYNGEKRIHMFDEPNADDLIIKKIKSGEPFMMARYGSVEFRNLFADDIETLCLNAGFFPNHKKYLQKFRKIYFKASKSIDILAIWNYQSHFLNKVRWLKKFSNIKYLIHLKSLGQETHFWIKALEGKRVLVINPFEATIKRQYKKRRELGILPKLKSLQIVKAVQTIAGNKDERFGTWFEALEYMKREIDKKKFDIALIGCGAYGLPLAAYVKSLGKQAIHMGGGLQLLFGIKGKRWEKSEDRFNKYWIYPLDEDVPKNKERIEGGCYWR